MNALIAIAWHRWRNQRKKKSKHVPTIVIFHHLIHLDQICNHEIPSNTIVTEIVSEYDQEIPQSQTADNPVAPRGRAAQPSRDTRKTN